MVSQKRKLLIGPRIKRLRSAQNLTQAELAARLGISATYVNLMERNQRPVSANILLELADVFNLTLSDLAQDSDTALIGELRNVLRDPAFENVSTDKNELEDLVGASPDIIRAFIGLHERYRRLSMSTYSDVNPLADREKVKLLEETARPVEHVRAWLHRERNYFAKLDAAEEQFYEALTKDGAPIELAVRTRLERLHGLKIRLLPSEAMPASYRYFDRHRQGIDMSELLPASGQRFQLAVQLVLLEQNKLIEEEIARSGLTEPTAIELARTSLANYGAAALLMPYTLFLRACEKSRYDIDLLGHRFGTSFEQTAHRLTTLQRMDARGIPFFFVRMDVAGNVSKRFSAGRFHFSKFGGACPRWNIHRTFEQPGEILTQRIEMPDKTTYLSIAKAVMRFHGHHGRTAVRVAIGLGCDDTYADRLIYFDNPEIKTTPTEIGINCYLCDRQNCESRAFAPLNRKLKVNLHTRGLSVYEFESDDN